MTPVSAFVQAFLWVVGAFFVLYLIGYATFLFLSVSVGASVLNRRKREARYRSHIARDCYVPVSIIVPAHNEGVTIVESVKSLMMLDYKLYEVIVVDDGSEDGTPQKVIEAFGLERVDMPIRTVLETDLSDVMEGSDRYARDMLAYRWRLERGGDEPSSASEGGAL